MKFFTYLIPFSAVLTINSKAQNDNTTEYFDSDGNIINYSKEYNFYKRIEYFDANGNLLKYEKNYDLYDRKQLST